MFVAGRGGVKRGKKREENDLQVFPCRVDLEGQQRAMEANRALGAGE